jgi:hypothetical protein
MSVNLIILWNGVWEAAEYLMGHLHPRTSVSNSGLYSWVDSPPAIMYEMNVIKTMLNDCTDKHKHN